MKDLIDICQKKKYHWAVKFESGGPGLVGRRSVVKILGRLKGQLPDLQGKDERAGGRQVQLEAEGL